MRQHYSGGSKIIKDKELIKEELEINFIEKLLDEVDKNSELMLIEKTISFADVLGKCGAGSEAKKKRNAFSKKEIEKRVKSNISFYTTYEDMAKFEKANKAKEVFFCQTHQTSIYMPSEFYQFLGIHNPTTRLKAGSDWKTFYSSCGEKFPLNSPTICVYAFNPSIEQYFTKEMTEKTYKVLNRVAEAPSFAVASGSNLTPLDIFITPHGLGKAKYNPEFTKLHRNIFAKDKILVLLEKKTDGTFNVYLSLMRNVQFFILNKIRNKDYRIARYRDEINNRTNQESRIGQSRWRDELAELAMSQSSDEDGFVTCPFTGVRVEYPAESAFLRASHIKAYSKCKEADGTVNVDEAYDLDNGFLVIADVDALFDKYLLSVDPETGKIQKSPILTEDVIKHLNLNASGKIDSAILESKKKYLIFHYNEYKNRNGISA